MNDSIIRTRYADALVKYVRETGNGESVCAQAEKLTRMLREVPDLSRMIAAKDVVPDSKKRALLRTALGEPMTPELMRFVNLLLTNGRIGSLRMVLLDFTDRYLRFELRASAVRLVLQQGHRLFSVEGGLNLCVARPVIFHHAVAFALLDGTLHHVVGLCLGHTNVGERGIAAFHTVECRLQILGHVFAFGLFAIRLHVGVDGRKDLQAVSVDVIVRAILLRMLVAPTIQWVGLPSQRVIIVLLILPRSIVVPVRLVGHHPLT